MDMEKSVAERAEQERHFAYYEIRKQIWDVFKANNFALLAALVTELEILHRTLSQKYSSVEDGYILLQHKWVQAVGRLLADNKPATMGRKELLHMLSTHCLLREDWGHGFPPVVHGADCWKASV